MNKYGSIVYHHKPLQHNLVVMFDLDYTIIQTKSGKLFSTGTSDWMFLNDNVPSILKLISETHEIIFFTNQKKYTTAFNRKLSNIFDTLDITYSIYISTSDDLNRKPCLGMFYKMMELNGFTTLHKDSYYCGDAAGRPWDFSASDLFFAQNMNVQFKVPENVFGGTIIQQIPFKLYDNIYDKLDAKHKLTLPINRDYGELIVMVGMPASGKSTICNNYFDNYVYINKDSQTPKQSDTLFYDAINYNKSVIIDNTNPSISDREYWIEPCVNNKYDIRIIYMDVGENVIKHLNLYRAISNDINKIPEIAFRMYKSVFEDPNEQSYKVYNIPFILNNNDNKFFMKYVSNLHVVGPDGIDYANMKTIELKSLAKQRGLRGYSKFRKGDLIKFIIQNI
jgi:DNA 3'-phosphatase